MEKVFVFGHKKPDTDSVTSAIVLSYLKNQLGMDTEPRVLGDINNETKYVLDYFKFEEPKLLDNVKLQIKDLTYHTGLNFYETDSIFNAFKFMNEKKVSVIPVVDENNKFKGIVSMKDITKNFLADEYNQIDCSFDNLLKTIDGEEILRFDERIKGQTIVSAYQHQTFIDNVKLTNDTILIVGDRSFIIEYAIKSKIKLIIVTGNNNIKPEHLELAKENKVNIIKTGYDSFKTIKYIGFADDLAHITLTNDIITFKEDGYVTEFTDIASKTKFSNYPVLDNEDHCLGLLKLANIKDQRKKKVILVDHNEVKQSADGLDEADVIEVIDHHNIGSIDTLMPITFRTQPVGCTNTILYKLYKEYNVEIPKNIAGLMISGIVSDTLLLKSPTTTDLDIATLEELSNIADIDYKKYGLDMLKAGTSLKGKTKEEILYTDFKNFTVGSENMGIGQIFTFNFDELKNDSQEYIDLLTNTAKNNDYTVIALFVTDVIKNGSYVFFNEQAKELMEYAYNIKDIEQGHFLPDVVSRKKQMVPNIMEAIKQK
ncbi:MAG: putative manganese-dependent inorganic diphosphatase [Bacilli bacterium]|nr:putative manganese-dependent inorganic diphosphatase [Bacilli bacterium]